jgi:hypothetical protein
MKKQSVKPTDGYHEELFAGGAISGEGRVSGMASGTANGSFTPGTEYSRPWASIPTASSMGPGNGGGKAASHHYRPERSRAGNRLVYGNAS